MPSTSLQDGQPRPPKRLFKATRKLSFEEEANKPKPIGDAKARKCLLCTECVDVKKLLIVKHLQEKHGMKARMCQSCRLIFQISQMPLHKCPVLMEDNEASSSAESEAIKNGNGALNNDLDDPYAFHDEEEPLPLLPRRRSLDDSSASGKSTPTFIDFRKKTVEFNNFVQERQNTPDVEVETVQMPKAENGDNSEKSEPDDEIIYSSGESTNTTPSKRSRRASSRIIEDDYDKPSTSQGISGSANGIPVLRIESPPPENGTSKHEPMETSENENSDITPTKRVRRAPSRLIEEDDGLTVPRRSRETTPKTPERTPLKSPERETKTPDKSLKTPEKTPEKSQIATQKTPKKTPERETKPPPKSPKTPVRTYVRQGKKSDLAQELMSENEEISSKIQEIITKTLVDDDDEEEGVVFDITEKEVPIILPVAVENGHSKEKVEKIGPSTSQDNQNNYVQVDVKSPKKGSKPLPTKKVTHSRFYKPEHTDMLVDLYERTNKYPSKEEMNELAKTIGVLPIKILWWCTHRRRQDKKKGSDVEKPAEESISLKSTTTKKSPPKVVEIKPVGDYLAKRCLECDECTNANKHVIAKHLKEKHELKIKSCYKCKRIFKTRGYKKHTCDPDRKVEKPGEETIVEENGDIKPLMVKKVIPDLSKKPVFYSRRYKNLLQEFSPKKSVTVHDHVGDMMQKTSVLRNGKLELNYVTPNQLKAVEEFLFGDPSIEKVYYFLLFFKKLYCTVVRLLREGVTKLSQ